MAKAWSELYDKLPAERRAEIELRVMHELEGVTLIDRCPYESVAWRCVKRTGHKLGHSPFLEDCECKVGSTDLEREDGK